MKLLVPAGTSSVSCAGIDYPVIDGMVDADGDAFADLHDAHGFLTEDEAAAIDAAAGKAAAVASAVVSALKKR